MKLGIPLLIIGIALLLVSIPYSLWSIMTGAIRLKTYATKAHLARRCTPHMLRYSFALQVIRNGCDPFTLQKILGHATLDMTRYVRLANTDVEKNMKAFSPAEQLLLAFQ